MDTHDGPSANPDSTDQPPTDLPAPESEAPAVRQPITGIGGCLLYPLVFLVAQPILFVYTLLVGPKSNLPMQSTRIFWPYMVYDLVMVGGVLILLTLFLKRKATLPALFVFFMGSITLFTGALSTVFSRLSVARVSGRDIFAVHMVLLFQCLILMPYLVIAERVQRTFTVESDDNAMLDRLVRPVALPAERLYNWLQRRGIKAILFVALFVVAVFILDFLVDSIVLRYFL